MEMSQDGHKSDGQAPPDVFADPCARRMDLDEIETLDIPHSLPYTTDRGTIERHSKEVYTMKKKIGNALALYPTPLVVVGAMVEGKPNWLLVGHLGIMGHDHVMISLAKTHYTNQGIRATGKLSINIVDEALLPRADHAGCVSGSREDKSGLFRWEMSDGGVPMISDAPVVMACTAADFYDTPGFDNIICTIDATYADEAVLDQEGRLDYSILKPVLFEMPTYQYLRTGDVLGKCMSFGKDLAQG